MINGKFLVSYPLKVFQAGHLGWFWSDERSIARGPFKSSVTARQARYDYAKRKGLKVDLWPEVHQSASTAREERPARVGAMTAPPPAMSPSASRVLPGRVHAATSATPRAAKRAKGRSKRGGKQGGKA